MGRPLPACPARLPRLQLDCTTAMVIAQVCQCQPLLPPNHASLAGLTSIFSLTPIN